jgi:hypothetical protein
MPSTLLKDLVDRTRLSCLQLTLVVELVLILFLVGAAYVDGVLAAGGLGAFAAYLTDRSQWGFLIPAYVLWAVAGLIALIMLNVLRDEAIATYVLAAIALPFLVVFLRDRNQ